VHAKFCQQGSPKPKAFEPLGGIESTPSGYKALQNNANPRAPQKNMNNFLKSAAAVPARSYSMRRWWLIPLCKRLLMATSSSQADLPCWSWHLLVPSPSGILASGSSLPHSFAKPCHSDQPIFVGSSTSAIGLETARALTCTVTLMFPLGSKERDGDIWYSRHAAMIPLIDMRRLLDSYLGSQRWSL